MSTDREQLRLRVPPRAAAILRSVGDSGDYIARVVEARDRAWRMALFELRQAGWGAPHVLAACEALTSYAGLNAVGDRSATLAASIAHELTTAEVGSEDEWNAKAWGQLVKALGKDQLVTDALTTVVREYLDHNAACEAAVRAMV